ncbi:cyclophilin-RNA interacting protein, putative [Perkinsus marinus ATCC 50983]|uniref:Cyclophilin-RNA interacting protein, putative n=1 Tax=Perkinsus marinus (strain ATCC 50983 / TXsc) TaxID=423536 RepID=C5LQN9_PERM5|nr:cyclophilin-RNA interacting protein, putative [Perkinsus marinus ATCC 50983]EER00774.1 cyclophilin-RNA interacting protein, putative [Perkinsus marinus ATCC 50983]|eukprot:XP_002768056.1 cyclophilin-RNA interacting protein, putative [Perkinsus marinus ATCC 50983]
MFGAVKVSGVKEKSKKDKKSKHRHHHHRERDVEAEPRDDSAGQRDSESSRSEEGPKRDEWMTGGSADPTADRLAAMFEMGKMAVPRMERKAAERRAEKERLRKESDERMNKIDLANDEGLSERAHMSEKTKATDPWALPESCLVNSGGRRWQARAARRRRESERDSGASETSSRERRHNDNDDGRSGHRGEGRRRGWGRSRSRSEEEEKRRPRGRAPRDDLAQLADKYHGKRDGSEGRGEEACPKGQVDADGLDANEVSAAAMRAMLAGDMEEYERLNSLMATKTVVVDETLKGQGALGSAGSSRAKMLSAREDNKDEDKMDVSELLRQCLEGYSTALGSGEYDKHLAENIRKNKRFQGSADEDEYFGATELGGGGENPTESMPAELSREKKRRYRGTGWVSEETRRKEERGERRAARRTQRECDLCMEHSSWARNREEKLIAVSPRVYICMANYKSTLLQGQVIIVPQNHCASLRTADEETAEEIRNYQKCLVHYYATMDPPCVPVFIETVKTPPQNDDVMALLGGGAHTTMQCFPIPHDRVKELESYMHVDFGLQVGLVHIIDKAKEFRWDYGLQTIAGMLEIDKLSLVHYDQPGNGGEEKYNEDMKVLRKAFEAFDWAKGLA